MYRYYVETEGKIVKNPARIFGKNIDKVFILAPFFEVTEEWYSQYKNILPATFEIDEEGNMVNIISLPKPTKPEPPEKELTLEQTRIKELESQIAGLQSAMAELTMMLSTPQ